jgi:hypothetical protein
VSDLPGGGAVVAVWTLLLVTGAAAAVATSTTVAGTFTLRRAHVWCVAAASRPPPASVRHRTAPGGTTRSVWHCCGTQACLSCAGSAMLWLLRGLQHPAVPVPLSQLLRPQPQMS